MRLCPTCRGEYDDQARYCPKDGARLVPLGRRSATVALYDPLIGEVLQDRYRVHGRIGEGSLAVVYAALHVLIEKDVALKVLKAELLDDDTIVKRFLQEAKAASRLSHPNIVSISDFGHTPQGAPFFVMERLVGPTLGDVFQDGKPFALSRAMALAAGIGSALGAAHRQGIVHRDVKPDNVLIVRGESGEETVKLVDFGLAKVSHAAQRLTRAGQILGTPAHMAPEQAAGEMVDHRADIFALGILFYRMVTGRLPFSGTSAVEVLHRLMDATPDPLVGHSADGLPLAPLWPVLKRALAREPEDRPADVDTFLVQLASAAGALEDAPAVEGAEAMAPGIHRPSISLENQMALDVLSRTSDRQQRQRRCLWMLLAAAVAILAGLLVGHRFLGATPSNVTMTGMEWTDQGIHVHLPRTGIIGKDR